MFITLPFCASHGCRCPRGRRERGGDPTGLGRRRPAQSTQRWFRFHLAGQLWTPRYSLSLPLTARVAVTPATVSTPGLLLPAPICGLLQRNREEGCPESESQGQHPWSAHLTVYCRVPEGKCVGPHSCSRSPVGTWPEVWLHWGRASHACWEQGFVSSCKHQAM